MLERPEDEARALVGRLYDSYGAALYRYAVILLADPAAAEDAVHQVFAGLLRHAPRLDDDAHYLRRAVRNECYSYLRRHRGDRQAGRLDTERPILEPVVEGVPPEERISLERAIRALPPDQREVVYLHVFEGLTFQQVATAADASINTVAARYRYALAKLRQTLTIPETE